MRGRDEGVENQTSTIRDGHFHFHQSSSDVPSRYLRKGPSSLGYAFGIGGIGRYFSIGLLNKSPAKQASVVTTLFPFFILI